jgi:hypothetical protein
MKNILVLLLAVFLLNACGSGGSGGDESSSQVKTGLFIDAPVEGLNYETPSFSGKTDTYGSFRYKSGETVTFKIGNMPIGSAKGSDIVTPLTLTGDTDINNISTKAVNIARLLQTLDANNSDNVSIRIPSALNALSVDNVDFSYEQDLERIIQAAESITSANYALIDSDEAVNHMRKYILAYSTYKPIDRISYTANEYKYYLLVLDTDSNVFFEHVSSVSHLVALQMSGYDKGIQIYDLDMNLIKQPRSGGIGSVQLSKGTYIVRFQHDTSIGGSSTVVVNYPDLIDQTSFPALKNGTYQSRGVQMYSLRMPETGSIQLHMSGGSGYLYDTNLNLLYYDINNVTELDRGDYVLIARHRYNGSNTLTVNSMYLSN